MTVVTALSEGQVDTVLANTQSIDTCSASTLRLLRALLGSEDTASDASKGASTIRSGKQKPTATKLAVKATKPPKIRSNANFTILDCLEAPVQRLPRNKQLALATNTFNKTLKNLGEALKAKQISSCTKPGGTRSPLKDTQGRIGSVSTTTLKPGTPGQRLRSKSPELHRTRAPSISPSFDCSALLATAECAATSLRCLRQLKVGTSAAEEQDKQLEQGALVLISKLQGLGLVAPAIEETLNVRKALAHALQRQQKNSKNGTNVDGHLSYGSLVDCVEFAYCGDNARTFALVTGFQAQVLQLIAVDKSSIDENLLQKLDPSNPRSPCRVLLHGAERGWVPAEKAALQLHALSQSVLSICYVPASSTSEKPPRHSSPNAQFQLQCFALQIRCHWWHFANHQPDFDKEIWAPFNRFVVSLRRKPGQAVKVQFLLVKRCLDRLLGLLSETQNALGSRHPTLQPSSTVMFTLLNMAEVSGSNRDSLDWLHGLKGLCGDLSGLPAAICNCKLAKALLLDSASGTNDLIPTLETAIKVFGRPLRGTAAELEDLLLQASSLRKAAAMRLTAINENLQRTDSHDESLGRLPSTCIRAIFGVLHFAVRYLGYRRQAGANATCTPKSSPRGHCSALVAQQSLKSALAAVQANLTHQYVGWELCNVTLDDCLAVPKVLNQNCQDVHEADLDNQNMPTTFVKVSNIFWSWYLKQKEASACTSDLVSILNRSVQALVRRTPAEIRMGFLAVKCETAAALYTELKQFDSAREILTTAINAHLIAGTLSVASERALTQSPQQIWGEADSPELMLGRVLSARARLLVKHQPNPLSWSFFDEGELKPNERALLLWKQFDALRDILVPETLHTHLKEVAKTVLSLYSESTHSWCRLRFISGLLTFCSRNHLPPRQFLPEPALKICMDGSCGEGRSSVEDPFPSARSLHSSLLLQWAFQTNTPSVKLLQTFVASHTMAMESCEEWTSILGSINDPALVMAQVQSVVDFADMRGHQQIKLDALLLMRRLLELQPEKDVSAMVSCTAHIGLLYTRMGLISQAGLALASAETSLIQSKSKTLIALQWHLAHAEYLTALSSYEKAAEHLVSAQWRYDADFICDQEHDFPGSRIARHKYLAQAAYVASNLAFENGDLDSAIVHAKKSVRLSNRLWSVLEKLLGVRSSPVTAERSDVKVEGLIEDLSNMTLSTEGQPKNSSSQAAAFWAYVQIHFDGLLHLSCLAAHYGSFQDAVYYSEQAKKVGEATGSDVLLCKASSILAAHFAQAGRVDESQQMLDLCTSLHGRVGHSAVSPQGVLAMANAHLARGEIAQAVEAVEQAQRTISKTQAADHSLSQSEMHRERSVKVVTVRKGSRSGGRTTSKARKPHHPSTKLVNRGVPTDLNNVTADEVVSTTVASTCIQRLQAEALLLKSYLCIRSAACEDARDLLDSVTSLARSSASDAWYHVLRATLVLADALRLLQSDAVYSVLAESTIAYPTRQSEAKSDRRYVEVERTDPSFTAVTAPACPRKKATSKQVSRQAGLLQPKELISRAREALLTFSYSSRSGSSSIIANELSCLLTRVELLSTLLSPGPSPSPFQIACHMDAPRSLHWSRGVASADADIVLGDKSAVFAWPEIRDFGEAPSACTISALDCAVLQQRFNETLPPSWNVMTVAMSDDCSEIFMSKMRRGQSPFLLRLPLERTAAEELDEEPFRFDTAKSELHDIIAAANLTAHDAKARSDKKGKKLWWAAREALDTRLASLLNNMETLWLGGFRGIFSHQHHDEELLSRFSESLTRTLDQQLPSRRKAGANAEPRLQLHSHVLQLFVSLGNPDESDLDDAITDLLYFVIDILQFQGERNAYDEVDFDAVVVEVNDALRSYHEAGKDSSSEQGGHTILVLDKALHAFPWESLPCLEGKSVTRMPSLSCLQERLLHMSQNDETRPGLYIDPQNGAYILNPSSDLTSTQETFLEPFNRSLVNYTSILNRVPSETEFEACLQDKDLCLYFGHGSGAQFIRGRTIKRLKQCAVTFLMGCSSSKMVECGQFEPYGVPYNYLHAGSAAVVGTLWDVTDKDIDRFAMETFVNWGLLDRDVVRDDTNENARKMRGNRKGGKQMEDLGERPAGESPPKQVGLDAAVAKARDACVLRYLNGAAPVIYGIPVYLNR